MLPPPANAAHAPRSGLTCLRRRCHSRFSDQPTTGNFNAWSICSGERTRSSRYSIRNTTPTDNRNPTSAPQQGILECARTHRNRGHFGRFNHYNVAGRLRFGQANVLETLQQIGQALAQAAPVRSEPRQFGLFCGISGRANRTDLGLLLRHLLFQQTQFLYSGSPSNRNNARLHCDISPAERRRNGLGQVLRQLWIFALHPKTISCVSRSKLTSIRAGKSLA